MTNSDRIAELIAEYQRIRNCSPDTPWCDKPAYSNADHYDGHYLEKDAVLAELFALVQRDDTPRISSAAL